MKCAACPLADRPESCPAVDLPHHRYCQLVDPDHPDHNPAYGPILVEQATGTPPPPPPASALAADLARRILILECDYRGEPLDDCGCGDYRRCYLERGRDGIATIHDCLACVSTLTPQPAMLG